MDLGTFLLMLMVILAAAKAGGEVAQRIGQPPVLGELLAGVVVGEGVLGLVRPEMETIHFLAEFGVLLLLFEIGLHSDLRALLRVGLDSLLVATIGVAIPFIMGYLFAHLLGWGTIVSIFLGATLTATSVGITARVMADLRKLESPEARIILGAAVADDVMGLLILAVVSALAETGKVDAGSVLLISLKALGFLAVASLAGYWAAPPFVRFLQRMEVEGALLVGIVAVALLFGWLAKMVGLAPIVGAFVAGLMLGQVHPRPPYEDELVPLTRLLTPIFFVAVGAAVHPDVLNPLPPQNRPVLLMTLALFAVAVLGKIVAGWGVLTKGVDKWVVGVGMVPRGEVGLIFANMGAGMGVLKSDIFSAVVMMLALTTFIAPPGLRWLLHRPRKERPQLQALRANPTPHSNKGDKTHA